MIGGYVGGIGTVPYIENGTTALVTVTEDADTLTSASVLALKASLDKTEDADTLTSAGALKSLPEQTLPKLMTHSRRSASIRSRLERSPSRKVTTH